MADFWDLIVRSNTFNFIVMLVILAMIWQKLNISEKLETMREEITNFIEKSRLEKENAEANLKNTQAEVANVKEEIEQKLESAKISAQNVFDEINKMTTSNIEKINANVDKIIDNETRKINSKLTNDTAQKAVDLAKEKLQKMFDENLSLHQQHIQQSIQELDRINF